MVQDSGGLLAADVRAGIKGTCIAFYLHTQPVRWRVRSVQIFPDSGTNRPSMLVTRRACGFQGACIACYSSIYEENAR
jgi:hypothetical protein